MAVDVPPVASSRLAANSVEELTDLCQLWPCPALLCPVCKCEHGSRAVHPRPHFLILFLFIYLFIFGAILASLALGYVYQLAGYAYIESACGLMRFPRGIRATAWLLGCVPVKSFHSLCEL